PKQPCIPPGRYGNWLRLPGRHHTRSHWSRIWDGGRWLEGEAAVAHVLALLPAPASLLPDVPQPARPAPRTARTTTGNPSDVAGHLARRIAAYMGRLPHLGAGQGRDDVAYHFAAWLVRDLQLTDEAALAWLNHWDDGNRPPKGEARLKEILASVHLYGQN